MASEEITGFLSNSRSLGLTLAGSIVFVVIVLAGLIHLDLHQELITLLEWVHSQGAWSAVLFILMMALVVVLLLPGVFFTTGAGFVFGIVAGTVYVVLGTTLGAAAAFLIARYFLSERFRHYILSYQKLNVSSRVAAQHSFTIVLLTRLIPFFPFKLSNYLFGLMEFSFGRYTLASVIGVIPFSLHNVYLGSMAADLASLSSGTLQRSPWQWAVYGLGFVSILIAVVFFSRLARSTLAHIEEREFQDAGAPL